MTLLGGYSNCGPVCNGSSLKDKPKSNNPKYFFAGTKSKVCPWKWVDGTKKRYIYDLTLNPDCSASLDATLTARVNGEDTTVNEQFECSDNCKLPDCN